MAENFKMRWAVVILVTLIGTVWIAPNFVTMPESWPFSTKKMVMGLDIQGGIHLVLGVDTKAVLVQKTTRMVSNLKDEFKDQQVPFKDVVLNNAQKGRVEISYLTSADRDRIEKYLTDYYGTVLQILSDEDQTLTVQYYDAYVLDTKKQIINQAIEVIRNRIDEFGVSEPSISAQGSDRILVQLPGIKDAQRAKDLINRTARLDFRVVSYDLTPEKLDELITTAQTEHKFELGHPDKGDADTAREVELLGYSMYVKKLNEVLASELPENTKVVFEKLENVETLEDGRRPMLVKMDSDLTGDNLDDASVGTDEYGRPQVNFRFNIDGRKKFADLSGAAVGGQVAIVLDDVVKSAPTIEERIDSDSARIRLGARSAEDGWKEAQFIATTLRAGALPAALEQLEERTVGPSLGADSIAKGQTAAVIGTALVLIFITGFYGLLGLVASIVICLNLLLVFATLSSLGATLTLPGVAGLALTVGMAVDANIIIFERIREELQKGASQMGAVRDGFGNAFSAIADSNITTILTCLILMYYGTGPIRGFAVTLAIGITASMFTAIFVSRVMIDTMVAKMNLTVMKAK